MIGAVEAPQVAVIPAQPSVRFKQVVVIAGGRRPARPLTRRLRRQRRGDSAGVAPDDDVGDVAVAAEEAAGRLGVDAAEPLAVHVDDFIADSQFAVSVN